MSELSEGWGFPLNSRKAHYFPQGEATSLCGRWMYTGRREADNGAASKDDCVPCRRKFEASS